VVEGLLTHLAGRTAAADKAVRFHACQLLQQLLLQLPEAVLEDDAVLETLSEALLERLQDKQPGVRAEAVKALCHLSRHQEVGCLGVPVLFCTGTHRLCSSTAHPV
jgi:condensin complex subunit 3